MKGESRIVRHVVVRGRVQGVGFRAFVKQQAFERGLRGWVRNRRDGSVEAVLAGPPATIDAATETLRKGPLGARVDALDQREATAEEAPLGGTEVFSVLPTV